MCGNEGRPLHEDPSQLEYNERTPESSFITLCLFSFNLATRGVKKMTYIILELMGVGPRPEYSTLSV